VNPACLTTKVSRSLSHESKCRVRKPPFMRLASESAANSRAGLETPRRSADEGPKNKGRVDQVPYSRRPTSGEHRAARASVRHGHLWPLPVLPQCVQPCDRMGGRAIPGCPCTSAISASTSTSTRTRAGWSSGVGRERAAHDGRRRATGTGTDMWGGRQNHSDYVETSRTSIWVRPGRTWAKTRLLRVSPCRAYAWKPPREFIHEVET
jgi:hypothetical protein